MNKSKLSVIVILIIAMLSICLLYCSCGNNYYYFETSSLNEYSNLKDEKEFYFRIFPEQIDNCAEVSFSYCEYNYHSFDVDAILICKYSDQSAYESAVNNEKERLKERYNVYESDGFLYGYTNLFIGSLSSVKNESATVQACLWVYENSYYMSHTLVSYSATERTIIYNHLVYNSLNSEKYEHNPYIADKLNINPFLMQYYSLKF